MPYIDIKRKLSGFRDSNLILGLLIAVFMVGLSLVLRAFNEEITNFMRFGEHREFFAFAPALVLVAFLWIFAGSLGSGGQYKRRVRREKEEFKGRYGQLIQVHSPTLKVMVLMVLSMGIILLPVFLLREKYPNLVEYIPFLGVGFYMAVMLPIILKTYKKSSQSFFEKIREIIPETDLQVGDYKISNEGETMNEAINTYQMREAFNNSSIRSKYSLGINSSINGTYRGYPLKLDSNGTTRSGGSYLNLRLDIPLPIFKEPVQITEINPHWKKIQAESIEEAFQKKFQVQASARLPQAFQESCVNFMPTLGLTIDENGIEYQNKILEASNTPFLSIEGMLLFFDQLVEWAEMLKKKA